MGKQKEMRKTRWDMRESRTGNFWRRCRVNCELLGFRINEWWNRSTEDSGRFGENRKNEKKWLFHNFPFLFYIFHVACRFYEKVPRWHRLRRHCRDMTRAHRLDSSFRLKNSKMTGSAMPVLLSVCMCLMWHRHRIFISPNGSHQATYSDFPYTCRRRAFTNPKCCMHTLRWKRKANVCFNQI